METKRKNKPRGKPFTKENQPTKQGDVGRKEGKTIGSICVFNFLNNKKFYDADSTPLTIKQLIRLAGLMITMNENDLGKITKDKSAPKVVVAIAKELTKETTQPADFIWKYFDKLMKTESVDTEGLTINYNRVKLKEKDATN